MIFFFNANGDLLNSVIENVYQGSNGANTIYFVGPFPETNEVSVRYHLPNGEDTGETRLTKTDKPLLQAQTELGKDYNVWITSLNKVATAYSGMVIAQFDVISPKQVVSTKSITFPVIKGVAPTKPLDKSTEHTLQEILAILSEFNETSKELDDKLNNKVNKSELEEELDPIKGKVDVLKTSGSGNSFLSDNGQYKTIEVDKTLTKEGEVADAKAVGDALLKKVDKTDLETNYYDKNQVDEALDKKADIKYVDDKFNGANKAVSFVNYSSMINSLNSLDDSAYNVGQNIMIVTLQVPDLWVSEVLEQGRTYTYVSDTDFISELSINGFVQVGHYKLSALETQKVDLSDYLDKTTYEQEMIDKVSYEDLESNYYDKAQTDEALGGKLDKYTGNAGNYRIYGVDVDGQKQMMFNSNASNYDGFVARWIYTSSSKGDDDSKGALITTTPVKPYHCANKKYVDEQIANNKPTLYKRVLHIYQEVYKTESGESTNVPLEVNDIYIVNTTSDSSGIDGYSSPKELANLIGEKYSNSLMYVGDPLNSKEQITLFKSAYYNNIGEVPHIILNCGMGMVIFKIYTDQNFTIDETITEV